MHYNTPIQEKPKVIFDIENMCNISKKEGNKAVIDHISADMFTAIANFEANQFIEAHKEEYIKGTNFHRYVRNGYHKARHIVITTGITLYLSLPRILDRCLEDGKGDEFHVSFCKKYSHSTESLDQFALLLYLKGISQTQISDIIYNLFNKQIYGFKHSTISRKKDKWLSNYQNFININLSNYNNHIIIIDATYIKTKNNPNQVCLLSVVAVNDSGYSVIGWNVAESESEDEWAKLFDQLTNNQMMGQPRMVVTDGGAGGLAAIASRFQGALVQRCWVHKTRNILQMIPRKDYKQATSALKKIYSASNIEEAYDNYEYFKSLYSNNQNILDCISDSIDQLLTFFKINDIESYRIYTTNVIESLFAVSKLRINRARGNFSARTVSFTTFTFILHLALPGGYGNKPAQNVQNRLIDSLPEQPT
jgi:transposase-like protein